VLVYDLDMFDSLEQLSYYVTLIQQNKIEFEKVYFVGNKLDVVVNQNEYDNQIEKLSKIVNGKVFKCSARTGVGV